MTDVMTLPDMASLYHRAGMNVLPTGTDKRPVARSWKQWESTRQNDDDVRQMSWQNADNIGVVCGRVSGNVMCIDFDKQPGTDGVNDAVVRVVCDGMNIDFATYPWVVRTRSGGWHVWIRIDDDSKVPNKELIDPNDLYSDTLHHVELRYNGHYSCAPSPDGKYRFVNGDGFPQTSPANVDHATIQAAVARIRKQVDSTNDWSNQGTREGADGKRGTIADINMAGDLVGYIKRKLKTEHVSAPIHKRTDDGDRYEVRIGEHGEGHGGYYVILRDKDDLRSGIVWNTFAAGGGEHGGTFIDAIAWILYRKLWKQKAGIEPLTTAERRAVIDEADRETGIRLDARMKTVEAGDTEAEKAIEYINRMYATRYNAVTGRIEHRAHGSESWMDITDRTMRTLCVNFQIDVTKKRMSKEYMADYLESAARDVYDPVQEYFDALPKWDEKTDYIAQLASWIPVRYPEVFTRHLRKWLIGTYATGYYGATQRKTMNEIFLIIVGRQGSGKTTYLRAIVPPSMKPYVHGGNISKDKDSKMEQMTSWISINDELQSLKTDDVDHLKAIISEETYRVRLPYGRFSERHPRRVSFCGSTNRYAFLTDESGNRRFAVHELTKAPMDLEGYTAWIDANRNHVWAQAKAQFGVVPFYFDQGDIDEAERLAQQFRPDTYEDHLIRTYMEPPEDHGIEDEGPRGRKFMTTAEIATAIIAMMDNEAPGTVPRADDLVRKLGRAMRKAGFDRTTVRRSTSQLPVAGYMVRMRNPGGGPADDGVPF